MNVQEWVRIAVVPVPVQIVLLLLIFHKKPQNWKSGRFFVTLSNLLDLNERGTIISFILLDWGSYALLCFAFMFQLKIILVRLLGLRGTAPKFILCLSFFNYLFTLLNCCLLQKQQMPGASALTPKAVCLNIPIPVYPMLWSLSAHTAERLRWWHKQPQQYCAEQSPLTRQIIYFSADFKLLIFPFVSSVNWWCFINIINLW